MFCMAWFMELSRLSNSLGSVCSQRRGRLQRSVLALGIRRYPLNLLLQSRWALCSVSLCTRVQPSIWTMSVLRCPECCSVPWQLPGQPKVGRSGEILRQSGFWRAWGEPLLLVNSPAAWPDICHSVCARQQSHEPQNFGERGGQTSGVLNKKKCKCFHIFLYSACLSYYYGLFKRWCCPFLYSRCLRKVAEQDEH